LAEHAARAAISAASINPEKVDHVIFGKLFQFVSNLSTLLGNVIQSSKDAAYLARTVGLRVGVPIEKPAVTVNRLCGSGFEAVVEGARVSIVIVSNDLRLYFQQILVGDSRVVLAGGTESMSQAPFVVRNIRFGTTLGSNYEVTLLIYHIYPIFV
jgi:acetyl-CoA acyltransferase 2